MTGKLSNIKKINKGDIIVREQDDAAKGLYLLLQGTAGVFKDYQLNSQIQIDVLSQGSFYGEMSLFLGKVPEHTVVALSDSIVIPINRKNVNEFLSGQPDMAFTIMEGVCKKFAAMSEKLEQYESNNSAPVESKRSSLFPEGHGSYTLNLNNNNEELLYMQKYTCPLCGHVFQSLLVLPSRLRLESTDKDLRVRYKDIEPLHYEICTCPNCYLSTPSDLFEGVSKRYQEAVNRQVAPYKLETYIATGKQRDTFSIFAGFYLAMLCAEIYADNPQLVIAGFWQKLSRLYKDCEDNKMYLYASEQAVKNYVYSYEHFAIPAKTMQQLCYSIGDLYARLGEYETARQYFYMAKTNKAGTNVMANQAYDRMEEMKELLQHP